MVTDLSPEVQLVLPFTAKFEGNIPWMYLDTAAVVTVGVGCALLSVEEALGLPFIAPSGAKASAEQIAADYQRVRSMKPKLLPKNYRCATSLTLSNEVVNTLLSNRLEKAVVNLRNIFPACYDTFPLSGRAALVDMMYNLGAGRAGPPASGFRAYHHVIAALSAAPPNWQAAASNCARNAHMPAFDARNAWTKQMFLDATKGSNT